MSEQTEDKKMGPSSNPQRRQSDGQPTIRPGQVVGNHEGGTLSNVRTGSGTPGSAALQTHTGRGTADSAPTTSDPGLTAILGQIAALNWEISGNIRVSREQEAILRQSVDPDWVEIKYPDVPYLPVAYYRKVLNDAFGPLGWALVEIGKPNKVNETYYLPCVLIAEGKPVAKAIGECEIKGGNAKLTDGDAIEACRSNAITRCCKTLGIAEELHWPAWIRKFKREHCREIGRDKWGNMVIARKDDEAGASLFRNKIEADEMSRTGGDPFIAEFERHAASIRTETLTPMTSEQESDWAEITDIEEGGN